MRVFVSGEDGLLPSALVSWMRGNGYTILNDALPKAWHPPQDILQKVGAAWPRSSEIDVLDRGVLERLRDLKPNLVIHAAAMVGTDKCILDEHLAWRCNVETTFNMALLARDTGARLVYMSTGAVYDPSPLVPRPYSALSDHTYPPRPRTIYGQTKYLGEQVCRQVHDGALHGALLIVRPGFVYGGLRDTSSTITRLAKAVIHDYEQKIDVMLDFRCLKDFLHVSDYLGIMAGLLTRGASGIYDIARGHPRYFGAGMRILYERYGAERVDSHMNHQPARDYLRDHFADGQQAWAAAGYVPLIDIEAGLPAILDEIERGSEPEQSFVGGGV